MSQTRRREPPPATAREALERAGTHGRRAVVEAIAAVRAMLDAVALGWSGRPSDANATLGPLAAGLDELAFRLDGEDAELPEPLVRAVLSALDQEIERWQRRSATDRDARSVLRAFLGVREILWELGFRTDSADGGEDATAAAPETPRPAREDAPRVRRLARVEGDR